MAARQKKEEPSKRRRPPASSPQSRENELIGLAHDLAEQQIRQGTASSQVVTHFLKLGSSRERLEQDKIRLEGELIELKQETMRSAARVEELYEGAISAMRKYQGVDLEDEEL